MIRPPTDQEWVAIGAIFTFANTVLIGWNNWATGRNHDVAKKTVARVDDLHECVDSIQVALGTRIGQAAARSVRSTPTEVPMPSAIQEAEAVLSTIASIAVDISVDTAELQAGQPVALPKVQVGSIGGKPVYLEGQLSLT